MVKTGHTLKIGLMLYPSCLPTGLFAGLDFFKAANLIAGKPLFEVKLIGVDLKPVNCGHGQVITPETTVDKFNPDAIVIPGFWAESKEQTGEILLQNKKLQAYLNQLPSKKQLWSYCTGVLLHASTGRLKDKGATATWWLAQSLAKDLPEVQWRVNQTCVVNPQDITASGANGFYAIYEEVIKAIAHKKVLASVQKYLMSPPLLDQNDPFYELEMMPKTSQLIAKIIKLVERKPASELSLNFVAAELGVSSKTLARHLKEEVRWQPASFLRLLKMKQAAELLMNSDLTISEVCFKVGFTDESNFSRGFKNAIKMSPAEYRQKFSRE